MPLLAALPSLLVALLGARGCYPTPVNAPIVEPFRAPACDYCPGHRGLEFGPVPGTPVRAVAPGRVTFAAPVAGMRYVVVAGDDGIRITYGLLASVAVTAGRRVRTGDVLGATTDRFLVTMRDGDRYVDPAPHLGTSRPRVRLVPADGSPPRPGVLGRPVCAQ